MRAVTQHANDEWRAATRDGQTRSRSIEQGDAESFSHHAATGNQAGLVFAPAILIGRGDGPMRASLVRQFQQVHGNRATSRLIARSAARPAVQRYVETAAAAYKDLAENNPDVAHPHRRPAFSAQTLTIDPARQVVNPLVNPDLKVADDGQMAIAIASQPKEFYAAQGIVDASNAQLEGVGSPLRLAASGTTLTVPIPMQHGATNQLFKIGPAIPGQVGTVEFSDKCNEIAASIIGKPWSQITVETAEAIFQGSSGSSAATLDFKGGTPTHSGTDYRSGPANVAELVANASGTPLRPADVGQLGRGPSVAAAADTAQKYGRLAPADLSARSREVGINQFAAPEVGEAFATHSVMEPGKHTPLDYTKENRSDTAKIATWETIYSGLMTMRLMSLEAVVKAIQAYASQFQHYVKSPWSWHFAGVVARSGGDWVTLENYNRSDDLEKAFQALATQIEATYRRQIDQIIADFHPDTAGKTLAEFKALIPGGVTHVIGELNTLLVEQGHQAIANAPSAPQMWFFQMYGSKKDQSFHEAMAGTGDFVNPLTVRWREPVTDKYVAECKAKLQAKVSEVLAAQPPEASGGQLNAELTATQQQANNDIDGATTKSEVTKITKRALAKMDTRVTPLSTLH